MAYEKTEIRPVREVAAADSEYLPQINAKISAGAQSAGYVKTVTIQLREWQQNLAGFRSVLVWVAASANGAPSTTNNTITVTAGTTIITHTAHAIYRIQTDVTGKITFTLDITAAESRFVHVELPDGQVAVGEVAFIAE